MKKRVPNWRGVTHSAQEWIDCDSRKEMAQNSAESDSNPLTFTSYSGTKLAMINNSENYFIELCF